MKGELERAISRNSTKIIAAAIIICILALGGIIGYKVIMSKPASTGIYFNLESDLPDPSAALKYGKIGDKDALNMIETGKIYQVAFTVNSREKTPTSYRYVIDSKIIKQEDTFTLNPGENKTVKVAITPGEKDKWTYDRTDSTSNTNTYDLTNDSWLGERIDYEVIASQNSKAYTYAPVAIDLGDYKKALNLNMTLDDLKITPYQKQYTTSTTKIDEKDTETYALTMSVKNNQLIVDGKTTTIVSKSRPEEFKITLYKENPTNTDINTPKPTISNSTNQDTLSDEHTPATIRFWYQIK